MSKIVCLHCDFPLEEYPQICENCGYINQYVSFEEYNVLNLYEDFGFIINLNGEKHTPIQIYHKTQKNGITLCYPKISLEQLKKSTEGELVEICQKVIKNEDLKTKEYKNFSKNILSEDLDSLKNKRDSNFDYYSSRIEIITFFQDYLKSEKIQCLNSLLGITKRIELKNENVTNFFENLDLTSVMDEILDKDKRKTAKYPSINLLKFFILRDLSSLSTNIATIKYLEENPLIAKLVGFEEKIPSRQTFFGFEKEHNLIDLFEIIKKPILKAMKTTLSLPKKNNTFYP